jgi:3-deoxy-manno-octulosonate cytidylyltransferase (CMP-KDO synthetase)
MLNFPHMNNISDAVILIPARFASSRFPGKPLAQILGISMIERVYNNCIESGFLAYVVTDNQEIEDHVNSFGGKVLRVDDDVKSGSERIYLAYKRHLSGKNYKLILNVQGDEPLLIGKELQDLVKFHEKSGIDIGTLVRKMHGDKKDFMDPNKVKVALNENSGQCFYFSRSPIPYHRMSPEKLEWLLHIGVYSYTPDALEIFHKAPASEYELQEGLEQLRALENGLSIGAKITDCELFGVDVPDDIKILEGVINGEHGKK